MTDRKDPYAQFNFVLEINGLDVAGFTEVSGINSESDIIEYREGSDASTVRKLPALRKVGNTLNGLTERKQGAIVLRDESAKNRLRWEFFEGWISKYEGPALNATANEAAIESIEIAIERLELTESK